MFIKDPLDPKTNQALQAWQRYIASGIPHGQALNSTAQHISSKTVKSVFLAAATKAREGSDFNDVIFELAPVLTPIDQNILIIGASSGRLEENMSGVVAYRQQLLFMRRRFQKSLVYPILLMVMSPWVLGLPAVFRDDSVQSYVFNGMLISVAVFGFYSF
ncbi:MAG: hypothetical protein CMK59_09430, partial [Proteobacteria bacterium]|nr:hypothetical protein [Pseudomonadota bacterium]